MYPRLTVGLALVLATAACSATGVTQVAPSQSTIASPTTAVAIVATSPTTSANSKTSAPPPVAAAIASSSTPPLDPSAAESTRALLTRYGFGSATIARLGNGEHGDLERVPGNYDDDPGIETVLWFEVNVPVANSLSGVIYTEIVFIDDGPSEHVLGREELKFEGCSLDFDLKAENVTSATHLDAVGRWNLVAPCMGRQQNGDAGAAVWTALDQKVRRVFYNDEPWFFDSGGVDPPQKASEVGFEGAPPKAITLTRGGKVVRALRFNAKAGRY